MPLSLQRAFSPEDDERAVYSVAAMRPDQGTPWRVVHASMLIVPEEFSRVAWSEWETVETTGVLESSSRAGAEFIVEDATWMIARAVLSIGDASRWFADLQHVVAFGAGGSIELPAARSLPSFSARLTPPEAILRVPHSTDHPIRGLASGLRRPIRALMWPDVEQRSFAKLETTAFDGRDFYSPGFELVGMTLGPWIDGDHKMPNGVLVGRAERRAWIAESRGADELRRHEFTIGWDPKRIDLAELELSYIARRDAAVVLATRVRLQDLDIDAIRGTGRGTVGFEAIGAGVSHEAALYSSSGELLDEAGPHFVAEKVSLSIGMVRPNEPLPAKGSPTSSGSVVTVGGDLHFPALEESLARQMDVEASSLQVLREAARRRVIDTREGALARLSGELGNAREELLVYDPWFGVHPEEWQLLAGLHVPVRVVTSGIARVPHAAEDGSRAPIAVALPEGVQARFRRRGAGMHDRVWIWRDGGIALGGSPSTFGHAPLHVRNLGPQESAEWRERFEDKWNDPNFKPVPLRAERS